MYAESLRHRLGDMTGGDDAFVLVEFGGVLYEIASVRDERDKMVLVLGGPVAQPVNATRRKIASMLATGEYLAPDAFDNLPDGIDWAGEVGRSRFCPSDSRELLRRWVREASKLLASVRGTPP